MADDSVAEFYVKFCGPKESKFFQIRLLRNEF